MNTEKDLAASLPKNEQDGIDFDALMRKYDTESRFRLLSGWRAKLITLLAVVLSCFHL